MANGNGHDKVPATPLSSVKSAAKRRKLKELAEMIRECNDTIASQELIKKAAVEELKPLVSELGLSRLRGEGWLVMRDIQVRKTLVPEKLIEQGVSMKIIEKATVKKEIEIVSVRKSEEE